jgi:hypothetical protein
MGRRMLITIVVLLAARAAGAQVTGRPPRDDRTQAPQIGTGAVKGRVVDGQTGSPVPRARVKLHGNGEPRTVITDGSGRFVFTALPAASYWLNVDKSTYLEGSYPNSGDTLRSPDFFRLLDSQVLAGVTVPLFHGGVIAGRVVDPLGDPVELANVHVMRIPRSGGGRASLRGGGATNDLGEFRVVGLEPGSYLLFVEPRRPPHDDSETAHVVPTFYPGVPTRQQALPIAVERGGSVTGLEFAVLEGIMSRVTGTLIALNGLPANGGSVNVRAIVEDSPTGVEYPVVPVKPNGRFELTLAPGEYRSTLGPCLQDGGPVTSRSA